MFAKGLRPWSHLASEGNQVWQRARDARRVEKKMKNKRSESAIREKEKTGFKYQIHIHFEPKKALTAKTRYIIRANLSSCSSLMFKLNPIIVFRFNNYPKLIATKIINTSIVL